jgi:hypothetical protein
MSRGRKLKEFEELMRKEEEECQPINQRAISSAP